MRPLLVNPNNETTTDSPAADAYLVSTIQRHRAEPVEALMPDIESLRSLRPSGLQTALLVLGATTIVSLYIVLPLVLASREHFGSLLRAVLYGALVSVTVLLTVLSVLRRTARARRVGSAVAAQAWPGAQS